MSRRERLERILEREREKDKLENKTLIEHTPAKYRKLLLSNYNRSHGGAAAGAAAKKKASPAPSPTKRRSKPKPPTPSTNILSFLDDRDSYKSVFQGYRTSETSLAMRAAKENSAWAKIAQFEQDMYSLQVKKEKLSKLKTLKEQRMFLDNQVKERELLNEEARQNREREAERIAAEVEKFKQDEANNAEMTRQRLSVVKAERERQVNNARARKQAELDRKREEEAIEIAEVKAQLEEEKRRAFEKKVNHRKEMMFFINENEARSQMKKEKLKLEREEDENMRIQYVKMLEDQDRAREASLQAMYEKSRGRAEVAGEQVVRENRLRMEREDQMLQRMQEEHEMQLQEAERAEKERQTRMIKEVEEIRRKQMDELEERMRQEREDMEKYFESVRLKDERENAEERRRQQERRQNNISNRHVLSQQMQQARQRQIVDEVVIAEPEKNMNAALLEQAKLMVNYEENPSLMIKSAKLM